VNYEAQVHLSLGKYVLFASASFESHATVEARVDCVIGAQLLSGIWKVAITPVFSVGLDPLSNGDGGPVYDTGSIAVQTTTTGRLPDSPNWCFLVCTGTPDGTVLVTSSAITAIEVDQVKPGLTRSGSGSNPRRRPRRCALATRGGRSPAPAASTVCGGPPLWQCRLERSAPLRSSAAFHAAGLVGAGPWSASSRTSVTAAMTL
jgi:hypothetical protein